jgi:putative PEP-CTERM system integral membrane protein
MMNEQAQTYVRKITNARGWAYSLFWSWNIIFLAFMFLGFAPTVLPEMMTAVRAGMIPPAFLVYAGLLTAIPVVAVILGLTILRRSPGRLLTLNYGVEGPLMFALATRFFVVRQMTPAITFMLSIAGLGIAVLLWQLLDRDIHTRGPLLAHLRTVGLTLLLLIGLYASAWIAFYVLPVAYVVWEALGDLLRQAPEWRYVPLWILGTVLLAYTATLFVVMPIAVPVLYIRAWWRGTRDLAAGFGRLRSTTLTMAVIVACAVLFVQTNRQPQHLAFALLETPPSSTTEAQALLDRREAIRAGLLNTYLAPVRYLSAVGEVRHVRDMYEWTLHMSPQSAMNIEQLYETVARPVLYMPVHMPEPDTTRDNQALREEPVEAAKLYEAFFDQPIIEGERDTVVRAVRSTWSIEQARSAWQSVGDREVYLMRQEITVTENDDWAEVELYEVYQNQTGQRQEVVYYFSLPESAVITGLWFGNSPDRDARFSYRVSPRGAAQALYRNEVRYNRDPALVEQIGPRQYRLRIFPVQPQTSRWEETSKRSIITEGPPLHMWLTWRVLASENAWPLPRLAEKRNVYWDSASVRLVNGKPMAAEEDAWLPASIPARLPAEPAVHRVDFPSGETIIAQPVSANDLPPVHDDLRLAIVLDRSRSMDQHTAEVKAALTQLTMVTGPESTVDVYLTASKYRGEHPSRIGLAALDPDSIMFYGGQNAAELLAQFNALQAGQEYDAVFVLTDGSGYELGAGDVELPIPNAPVWMVHLGGDFPLGYDDGTLGAIQASGGGVAGNIEEALIRLTVAREAEQNASSPDVIDGYTWSIVPTEAGEMDDTLIPTAGDGFAALAARRLILDTMQRQRDALNQNATLDGLHRIAIEQGIVTPYSSMIVLVNQRQDNLLDQLEARGDRFQRESEEIGETTPQSPFSVTGVPEPEEWLLLALAAAMLIWFVRTRARTFPIHKPGE